MAQRWGLCAELTREREAPPLSDGSEACGEADGHEVFAASRATTKASRERERERKRVQGEQRGRVAPHRSSGMPRCSRESTGLDGIGQPERKTFAARSPGVFRAASASLVSALSLSVIRAFHGALAFLLLLSSLLSQPKQWQAYRRKPWHRHHSLRRKGSNKGGRILSAAEVHCALRSSVNKRTPAKPLGEATRKQ